MSFKAPGVDFSEQGSDSESHVGFVVYNEDPDKKQRVKVIIPSKLEGDVDTLPWILPIQYSPFGIGDNYGVCHVPTVGSRVNVHFPDNDLSNGYYEGHIVAGTFMLPEDLATNYPHRVGYVTPNNDVSYYDRSTGVMVTRHHSGTGIAIDNDGNMTLSVAGNLVQVVKGNYTIQVGGDFKTVISGSQVTSMNGDRATIVGGSESHQVTGSMTESSGGKWNNQSAGENRSGPIKSAGDVVAVGTSTHSHVHDKVRSGSDTSGKPVA